MGAGGCMFCTRSVEDAPQRIAKTLFSKRWSRIFGCLQDGPTDNKDGIDTCPIPYKVKVSQDCDGWCMPTHSRIKNLLDNWTSALKRQTKTEVQLKEASDDVPQGQIGQIMGVQYNGDGDAWRNLGKSGNYRRMCRFWNALLLISILLRLGRSCLHALPTDVVPFLQRSSSTSTWTMIVSTSSRWEWMQSMSSQKLHWNPLKPGYLQTFRQEWRW